MSPAQDGSMTLLQAAVGGAAPGGEVAEDWQEPLVAAVRHAGGRIIVQERLVFSAAVDSAAAAVAAVAAAASSEASGGAIDAGPAIALHSAVGPAAPGTVRGGLVDRARHIMRAAHPGQVLLSGATHDALTGAGPAGCTVEQLGTYRLFDLLGPERLFQLVAPGRRADFPPPDTLDRYPHNLPVQPTRLVGRAAEIDAAAARLKAVPGRLLTLTGAGGSGKTRFALQLAAQVLPWFEDGVFFVSLAAITDPQLIAATVADALALPASRSDSPRALLERHLAERHALLVLDNFEQILAGAPLVAELLAECPRLTVMVTSREALEVRGQQTLAIAPLSLPNGGQAVATTVKSASISPAVELFVDRAREQDHQFRLSRSNAEVITQLCRRLDGLPLAIELAAARIGLLTPQEMVARLEQRLPVLAQGTLDAPARQRTLAATVGWSHDLLEPEEQRTFRRLAVFAGGCTLADVEALCGGLDGEVDGRAPLDLVASLSAKSLLERHEAAAGSRFRMLETVRADALQRLAASGEEPAFRQRHARRFRALAQQAADKIHGPDAAEAVRWFSREIDNIRTALHTLADRDEYDEVAEMVAGDGWGWHLSGHVHEALPWLERVSADNRVAPALAATSSGLAAALLTLTDTGERDRDRGAALAQAAEDAASSAETADPRFGSALFFAAIAAHWLDQNQIAHRRLLLCRKLGEQHPEAWSHHYALRALGLVAPHVGMTEEQEGDYFAAALDHARRAQDVVGISYTLRNSAGSALHRGELIRAEQMACEALPYLLDLRDTWSLALVAEQLAVVASEEHGDGARAARLFGAAATIRQQLGMPTPYSELPMVERAATAARSAAGDSFDAAFAQGAAMSITQLVRYALRQTPPEEEARMQRGIGALDAACECYARAAEELADAGDRRRQAAALWAWARTLRQRGTRGDRQRAGQLLEQAREMADRAAAPSLRERIEGELAKAEPAEQPAASDAARVAAGLSKREVEVLGLVAAGRTNQEVAVELFIAASTVGNHLSNIFAKINAANRAEATAYALQHGILSAERERAGAS